MGASATFALCYALGLLALGQQRPVDIPLLHFVEESARHSLWARINEVLTLMGKRLQARIVCFFSAVVLPILWRGRGWYLPVTAIAVAYSMEKFLQQMLVRVVDRGRPPISTLGTFPSAGCARLIAIYGLILSLFLLVLPQVTRGARIVLWSLLSVAAYEEEYTRVYPLKHGITM